MMSTPPTLTTLRLSRGVQPSVMGFHGGRWGLQPRTRMRHLRRKTDQFGNECEGCCGV